MSNVIDSVSSPLQRALVFQGGGSLGAYEAGVFHVLYHWIKKDLSENENVLDIIAGTSIGAINASIIINHFLENKEKDKDIKEEENEKSRKTLKYWEGSPEKLLSFWKMVSSHNTFYDFGLSLLKNAWDFNKNIFTLMLPYYKNIISTVVSGESLRRYYSTKKMIVDGEPYVFSPLFYPPFPTPLLNKFFDYSPSAWWYQYSNQPLRKVILDFAANLEYGYHHKERGIKTNIDKNEPRFLLIASDIETAQSQTFDSYSEKNITIEHVLASASIPINYPYMEIDEHKYWDGGILSNTPLRELISSHTTFWTKKYENKLNSTVDSENDLTFDKWGDFHKLQKENIIPNLLLTIVNLHPQLEKGSQIPGLYDYDMTKDRENDIRFHDKTDYDIKLALNVSDYHEFVERMTNLASNAIKEVNKNKGNDNETNRLKQEFQGIVNSQQRTLTRDNKPRYFYDLIGKRFDIYDVLKIQRKDDIDTVSNKIFDFSSDTILNLIKEGEKDALDEIIRHELKKDENDKKQTAKNKHIKNKLLSFINDIELTITKDDEYLIEQAKIYLE